jgi:CDP-4-dehydro-6-deoxyglucose reductase, E3
MFKITLNNNKSFICDSNTTIFEAAKNNGIILEHSCLTARCRSCAVQLETGTTKDRFDDLILSNEEKLNNWILSCNAIPTSDILLNIDDLGDVKIFEKKIVAAKILSIRQINEGVIEVQLRFPPNSKFKYNSGQYVNISKGELKRSYSIANNFKENGVLTFYIKRYEKGFMSKYWFDEAKENDLLRVEGPLGSFFLRETEMENIVFIATGTGIAPINAMLEAIAESSSKFLNKNIWIFVGARYEKDLFWNINMLHSIPNLKFIPVLSRGSESWNGETGYVQDIVIKHNIPLSNTQVYACGSNMMIEAAKAFFVEKGLDKRHFFSDAFVATN